MGNNFLVALTPKAILTGLSLIALAMLFQPTITQLFTPLAQAQSAPAHIKKMVSLRLLCVTLALFLACNLFDLLLFVRVPFGRYFSREEAPFQWQPSGTT